MANYRMCGVVQVGQSQFIREGEVDGRKRYRVEAPVRPYFGREPRPGATWTHQRGICSSGETWESIEARNTYQAGIYGFQGSRQDFPYLGD